jgi:hypothetical protein
MFAEIAVLLISCLAAITVFVGNYRFFNDVLPRMIAIPSNYYHHTPGSSGQRDGIAVRYA